MNIEYECNGSWFHLGDEKWIKHHVEKNGGEIVSNVPVAELAQTS